MSSSSRRPKRAADSDNDEQKSKKSNRGRKPKRPAYSSYDDDEEFQVEKIIDKKTDIDGEPLYYIKWLNWPSSTNTWEPLENLSRCKDLVERFEAKRTNYTQVSNSDDEDDDSSNSSLPSISLNVRPQYSEQFKEIMKEYNILEEIPPGRELNEIIGIMEKEKKLIFLVKWKEIENASVLGQNGSTLSNDSACGGYQDIQLDGEKHDIIISDALNERYPKQVIKFYENRINWSEDIHHPLVIDRRVKETMKSVKDKIAEDERDSRPGFDLDKMFKQQIIESDGKNDKFGLPHSDDEDDGASSVFDSSLSD